MGLCLYPSNPLIPSSVRLQFTPFGSAPDPLNQQVNHVTSRLEETPSSAMLDKAVLSIMSRFETDDAGKLAN